MRYKPRVVGSIWMLLLVGVTVVLEVGCSLQYHTHTHRHYQEGEPVEDSVLESNLDLLRTRASQ